MQVSSNPKRVLKSSLIESWVGFKFQFCSFLMFKPAGSFPHACAGSEGVPGVTADLMNRGETLRADLIDHEPDSMWVQDHSSRNADTPSNLSPIAFVVVAVVGRRRNNNSRCTKVCRKTWRSQTNTHTRRTWWSEYRRVSFSPSPASQFHPRPPPPASPWLPLLTPSLHFASLPPRRSFIPRSPSLHLCLCFIPLLSRGFLRCHWRNLETDEVLSERRRSAPALRWS